MDVLKLLAELYIEWMVHKLCILVLTVRLVLILLPTGGSVRVLNPVLEPELDNGVAPRLLSETDPSSPGPRRPGSRSTKYR